jgi:hypothetical protein
MTVEWKTSFVAMSAVMGEPLEDALATLEDAGDVSATPLVRTLRSSPRDERARAIAAVLLRVVSSLPQWGAE